MTAIAFDGRFLAVDSMASNEQFIASREAQKLWRDVGGFRCVAMAGRFAHFPLLLAWLERGAHPQTWDRDWDAVAWAVDGNGILRRYHSGHPDRVTGPDADGAAPSLHWALWLPARTPSGRWKWPPSLISTPVAPCVCSI